MIKQPITKKPELKNQKNYAAYLARYTMAINKNINTDLRIPVLKRACELLYRFDDYLQEQTINKWVEEFNLSKKQLMGFLNGDKKPELSPSDELKEALLTYDIRQNLITEELTITRNKKKYTMDELELTLLNEGIQVTHLKKFVNSNNKNISVTKIFNPLQDFCKNLAENYKGEKLISELADCIPAMEFSDKENGAYQKRLEYYLRKWLYKAIGQTLGIGANDAMLLFLEGSGGSGKSYLIKWLFSLPEFKRYYIRIGENSSYMPLGRLAAGKFIIDFDELPLSKKRYPDFKNKITSMELDDYSKKTASHENHIRQANFIGSSNKVNRGKQTGYLLEDDDAMKRRIIPLELIGRIDYVKYTKDIDLYQLLGEAAAGILQAQTANNKNLLTWECDWNDLREQNSRYLNEKGSTDVNIILQNFKPSAIGKGRVINPSEMLNELTKKGLKTIFSVEQIGSFLAKNNYIKGRKGNYKGWWVKE